MRHADADLAQCSAAAEPTSTGGRFHNLSALASYAAAVHAYCVAVERYNRAVAALVKYVLEPEQKPSVD
jgi:hypothetical protein